MQNTVTTTLEPRADRVEWQVNFDHRGDSNEPPEGTDGKPGTADRFQVDRGQGNVYGSLLANGKHSPVLDLDAVKPVLIPSTNPGNFHLYLEGIELDWETYAEVLTVLGKAGILQEGFVRMSLGRKGSFVRKPNVAKGSLPQL